MPTVLRWNGFRFYFFSNEAYEPPHIHVDKNENTAKFWLNPVDLARNYGFTEQDIRVLLNRIVQEQPRFLEKWDEYFN